MPPKFLEQKHKKLIQVVKNTSSAMKALSKASSSKEAYRIYVNYQVNVASEFSKLIGEFGEIFKKAGVF